MRIDAGRISFFPPPGLRDLTGYYFIAPSGSDRIEIGGGFLPHGVSDLDGMVGSRRSDLPVPIESQKMISIDGHPARTLSFTAPDRRGVLRGRLAIALDPAPSERPRYVQIAFVARADDEGEAGRFEHIVASASFAGEGEREHPAPPAGWVRRYAGRLWLDVPEDLPPPRTYVFQTPDETMRIEVALVPGVDPGDEPGIEREIERDLAQGGAVRDRTETEIAAEHLTGTHLSGTLHAYTITRADDGVVLEDVVRRAHLLLRDVPVAHVYGRAPSIDAPALTATLDALVRSIEETGRR